MEKSRLRILILSFLLPPLILLTAFSVIGAAPFGEKSTLIMDMSDQYIEFLCGLKNADVYFSWSKSFGTSYVGVFAYYVSSPLSALTLLAPNESMPVAVLFLTALKVGLCGLSFALFLLYRFRPARAAVIPFAVMYGLMSYNVAYSMCIMWLDGVFWLPVILIGAERLLEGKGGKLFTAALFASFVSNYYISYMSGLFTALYFIWRMLENHTPRREALGLARRFALGAVTAAMLAAFLLVPTALSLFQGKLGDLNADYGGLTNFTWTAFLYKLLPGSYDSLTNAGAPFVYCGLVPFALFAAFFFLRGVSARSRVLTGGFALLLLLSLWLSPLDKIWHAFQYPNWFPYRYAFVLTLLMLMTAYRAFILLRFTKRALLLALTLFCAADLFVNAVGILGGLDAQFGYENYADYRAHSLEVQSLLAHTREDGGFVRVGATAERSKNEPIGFGYNGITHYSSAYNQSVNRLQARLGFAQAYFWNSYFGSTEVMDALFSVKYILTEREAPAVYEYVAGAEVLTLWRNDGALPPALAVGASELAGFSFAGNPFESQNRLVRALGGTQDDCFVPLEAESLPGAEGTSFQILSDGRPVYALFSGWSAGGWLRVNGESVSLLFTNESDCIQYLGVFPAGETVEVIAAARLPARVVSAPALTAAFYALDTRAWQEALEALHGRQLMNARAGGRSLSGTAPGGADTLFTTIPHDDGWAAYVDGKRAKTSVFADTFLTVALPDDGAAHAVELRYTAPGLRMGVVISAAALLLLTARELSERKRRRADGAAD